MWEKNGDRAEQGGWHEVEPLLSVCGKRSARSEGHWVGGFHPD